MMNKLLWIVGSIGLAAIGIYVIMAIYLLINQTKMVFIPSNSIEITPAEIGLEYEDIFFVTEDSVRLNGWFIPAKSEKAVLLFCHGNGGNISHRLESFQLFNRLGLSIFIFDYRGYGKSGGSPTEEGTYLDARAAWNYIVREKGIAKDKIVILGRSLGGAVAAHLAREVKPQALVVESAFTSVGDLGAELYPFFPVRLLSRFKYATVKYVSKISCPILIVHSPEDDIIPYHHGQKIYEAAHEPKQFLKIKGLHNDGFLVSGKQYEDGVSSFINNFIG